MINEGKRTSKNSVFPLSNERKIIRIRIKHPDSHQRHSLSKNVRNKIHVNDRWTENIHAKNTRLSRKLETAKSNIPKNENLHDVSPMKQTNVKNHQRNKKKTFTCCYVIFIVFTLIITVASCAVTATVMTLTFQKSTSKVTPSPNPSLRWNLSGITILGVVGVTGTNSNMLFTPYGLAFDSSSTFYIADMSNSRIQKLLINTMMAVTVAGNSNGIPGASAQTLNYAPALLFDANDNMYISDRANDRIQLWMKNSSSGITVAGINGSYINRSLAFPTGLARDPNSETIFIAESSAHRVTSYPLGAIVAGGSGPGNSNTQLYTPFGLIYDAVTQSLVISNYQSNNIVRWSLGASNRTNLLGDISGSAGSTSTQLNYPIGISMDPMGNIYVADSGNHRIQFFLNGQSSGTTIAGTGAAGINANQLNTPYWVILDNQLNLYVSDTNNARIQKFLRY